MPKNQTRKFNMQLLRNYTVEDWKLSIGYDAWNGTKPNIQIILR
jgi:hypothetical protein